jgi:hypothetical protein
MLIRVRWDGDEFVATLDRRQEPCGKSDNQLDAIEELLVALRELDEDTLNDWLTNG